MDTSSIYSALKKNKTTKEKFEDVYAADTLGLRKPCNKTKFLIVNLDPSHKSGSHWVAMMIRRNKPCEYFDSYGKPPPYPVFETVLKNNYFHNTKQLQHSLTTTCGQWTMLYIWDRCRGTTFPKFLSKFSKRDYLLNDHIVNEAVKKLFNTSHKVIDKNFLCQQICISLKRSKCIHLPHKKKCKIK